eukprot:7728980-Alexandrium_andersonii.AAC.1
MHPPGEEHNGVPRIMKKLPGNMRHGKQPPFPITQHTKASELAEEERDGAKSKRLALADFSHLKLSNNFLGSE